MRRFLLLGFSGSVKMSVQRRLLNVGRRKLFGKWSHHPIGQQSLKLPSYWLSLQKSVMAAIEYPILAAPSGERWYFPAKFLALCHAHNHYTSSFDNKRNHKTALFGTPNTVVFTPLSFSYILEYTNTV